MCLNYQMILFSKFNHNNNPVISFLAGNIYVYCMGAVLFVNIGIMVLNMYRGAKRRRILKGLKQKAKDKKINDQKMNELLMEKFGVKDPQKEKKAKLEVSKVNMADEYSKN